MNFNDLFLNQTGETLETTLPLFTEMAVDFETGEPLTLDGELIFWTGAEALKVWIWRALKTELNKYRIHSADYGNELHLELGHVYNRSIKEQLLYDEIKKTLLVNPYISSVSNFSTSFSDESMQQVSISFEVETIYGNIRQSKEVFNV